MIKCDKCGKPILYNADGTYSHHFSLSNGKHFDLCFSCFKQLESEIMYWINYKRS